MKCTFLLAFCGAAILFLVPSVAGQGIYGPRPDTEGYNFTYIVTRNSFADYQPSITLFIVTYNGSESAENETSSGTFRYITDPEDKVHEFQFKKYGVTRLELPILVWRVFNDGVQFHYNTQFTLTALVPVNIYIFNEDYRTNTTDVALLLPESIAGTNYAVNLPNSAPITNGALQYQIVHILPLRTATFPINVTVTTLYDTGVSLTNQITITDHSKAWYIGQTASGNHHGRTYYITASQPILVSATVTCTPVIIQGGIVQDCDFATFMPPPLYQQPCDTPAYDLHGSDTYNSRIFYVAPPAYTCNTPQGIEFDVYQSSVHPTQYYYESNWYIRPLALQPQTGFGMVSTSTYLQVTRLGGVTVNGNHTGAYLNHVPSQAQYLTGLHYFFIFYRNAHIQVVSTTNTVVLDNVTLTPVSQNIDPLTGTIYAFTAEVPPTAMFPHTIQSNGNFSATIIGYHHNNKAYGYELGYFRPQAGSYFNYTSPTTQATVPTGPTVPTSSPGTWPTTTGTGPTETPTNVTVPTTTITTTSPGGRNGVLGMEISIMNIYLFCGLLPVLVRFLSS